MGKVWLGGGALLFGTPEVIVEAYGGGTVCMKSGSSTTLAARVEALVALLYTVWVLSLY